MWEHKSGIGLWEDWVNSDTGEHSITTLTPKTIWKSCKDSDHFFEWFDIPKRIIKCKKCKMKKRIILGMQKLVKGRIVNLR